ncbi:MAG: hypothetical protein QOJ64_1322 [Acidobacteriota bacterium]|jgi:hypothetical protein|nr:hypothetical protein [Acidobacteriota bacterium]
MTFTLGVAQGWNSPTPSALEPDPFGGTQNSYDDKLTYVDRPQVLLD